MNTTNDNSNASCASTGKQQLSPRPDDPNVEGIAGPLLLTAKQAAKSCGKSLRTWRTWDAAGRIPRPMRIGRSTLWRADELRRWVLAGCPRRAEWEGRTC